jgi:hypothetical protein
MQKSIMNPPVTEEILNRLMVMHHRSLPTYLRDAPPWMGSDRRNGEARAVLSSIARDHESLVDEIGELLLERNWVLHYGEYPLKYTAYHDLSLDFVLDRLIEQQRLNVERIEQSVGQLERDPVGRALAERALGAAKAHLEQLQALKAPRAPSTA